MSRLINIDDSRNCYIGMDGEYETWDIDPNVIAEAQPQRKTGKWGKAYDGNDGHVKCTGCFKTYDWISQAQYYNFCPNCGADMRGEKNETD